MIEATKYDLDVEYGLIQEKKIRKIFESGSKIEVKAERARWYNSGMIAIEIECKGRPSGLSITQADYWMHMLMRGDEMQMTLLFSVAKLKELVKKALRMPGTNIVYGGDNKASKLVLIPLSAVLLA
jgi:hypothetical protein